MTRKLWVPALVLFLVGCPEAPKPPPPQPPVAKPSTPTPPPPPKPEEISVTSKSKEALATFKKGRYLAENARVAEAMPELAKAVQQDPEFALALAYQGFFTPTEEGMKLLQKASQLAANLPEAERLYVEHLLTWRQNDDPTLRTQRKRLAQLAPNDWRVHLELGIAAQEDKNWREAEAEFRKALELNPEAGAAHDLLGRALMGQGKYDEAIAALSAYVKTVPTEPNGFDLLGDAQLRAGKLAEAEASFQKATELSSAFLSAWSGLATTRFLQGEFDKGRAALTAGQEHARPAERLEALTFAFWSYLAEGKAKEAIGVANALEKDAKEVHDAVSWALAPVLRGAALTESGRHADALRELPQVLDRAKKTGLGGDALSKVYRTAFLWKIRAEVRLGKKADAEKSLAFLAKAVSMSLSSESTSTRAFAQGLVSWAKGEKEIAVQQLLECSGEDWLCRVELANVKQESSDTAGAEEIRKQLMSANRRDGPYVYARALVGGLSWNAPAKGKGKKP